MNSRDAFGSRRHEVRSQPFGSAVSPLIPVRNAFRRIAHEPVPLPTEVAARLGERPSWGRLRQVLLGPALGFEVQDEVWVWLVRRARRHGPNAMLACAGMALPMLGAMALRFSESHGRDRREAEAAILTGFLAKLGTVDLVRPGVWPRLRWAAYTAARAWASAEDRAPIPVGAAPSPTEETGQVRGTRQVVRARDGHPELLLCQAVAEGVLTQHTADLIATTRLQPRTSLTALAAQLGQPYPRLHKRRARAERALAAWLAQRIGEHAQSFASAVECDALDAATRTQCRVEATSRAGLRAVSKPGRRSASSAGMRATQALPFPASTEVNRRCA
ncbi:hypothetical protein ACFXHA_45430 [Nocardia sp. NPDC059240]|uniref:hypothetical protein n=1 Tax=Nocardia sp. NPDC059240 TaxID=3346786 RepID=UPI0036995486